MRPPGAESNAQLVAACDRCGRCLQACPGIVTPVPLAENLVAYGTPTPPSITGAATSHAVLTRAPPARRLGGTRERDLGVAVVVKDACVAWDWVGCTVEDECPVGAPSLTTTTGRSCIRVLRRLRQVRAGVPSASLRAYDASVEDKGIVVVSRSSEAAQATGAVSSEELASKRTVAVAQANAASPHTKGVHPDGPDATREAGA
ncbi:MAG: 4Fe-4S dicluster domain-containing protein [Eggerthella lenta]